MRQFHVFAGWFSLLVAIWIQPVPCEQQGQDTKPGLIPGEVPELVAEANLRWFESQRGDIFIPEGVYWFSRAPRIKSGQRVRGAGMDRTFIRNAYCYSPFGDNCSLQILQGNNPGYGYADGFFQGPTGRETAIVLKDPSVEVNYQIGGLVFTWKWDGYADGGQNRTRVRSHRITGKAGGRLTLDSAPDPEANAINWTVLGVRIAPVQEKAVKVTCTEKLDYEWKADKLVRVTGGPTVANEMVGEFRRIVSIANGVIELDRPLRQSYGTSASLLLASPVSDACVSDLTIKAPPHPQGAATYFSSVHGLTLERVRVEGDFQITLSSNVRISNCRSTGSICLNGTHDADVNECRCRHAYCEELVFDATFRNTFISMPLYGGFVSNDWARSERISLLNVVIEGAIDTPVWISGRECLLDNVRVQGSRNTVDYINSYLGGDDFQVRGFRSDLPLVMRTGLRVSLLSVRPTLYLGWANGEPPPVGSAVSCPSINTHFLPDAVKAQWAFAANSAAVAVQSTKPTIGQFIFQKTKLGRIPPPSLAR